MNVCVCPECDEVRGSVKAMHWHLRCEHGLGAEEAFAAAGDSVLPSVPPANWQSNAGYMGRREKVLRWNRTHNYRDQFHPNL